MNSMNRSGRPADRSPLEDLPTDVPDGSSILVAKPAALTDRAVELQIAEHYAAPGSCHLVLSTDVDGAQTVEQYRSIGDEGTGGRCGVVDASDSDHPSAPFQTHPIVSLPNPADLSRIVLALQQLESTLAGSSPTINVVARSLTPVVERARHDQVMRVVEQLVERQRSAGGVAVFGLEYTRHDDRTMTALRRLVDAVVWVETSAEDIRLDLDRGRIR